MKNRNKLEDNVGDALGIIGGLLFGGLVWYSFLLFRDVEKIKYSPEIQYKCAHRFSGLGNYDYKIKREGR